MTKTKNERITTLENEVAELKLIVHELRGKKSIEPSTTSTVEDIIEFEGQQYRKVDREAKVGDVVIFKKSPGRFVIVNKPYESDGDTFVDEDGDDINIYNGIANGTPKTVDVYELIKTNPLTPNQQRAAIIEKAKKFVKNVSSCQSSCVSNEIGNETYQGMCTDNEFIINNEKRTVVVLVRGVSTGQIYEKGIAKCNPSDVFNEHIGKAIALGRALGLDVSEFEQAGQPSVFVEGMEVTVNYTNETRIIKQLESNRTVWFTNERRDFVKNIKSIINDTNAKYEEG